MSGFTDEERAAELKRRDDAIKSKREAREAAGREAKLQQADTRCIHCGNPMISWEATDPENPLCDTCLY